MRCGYQEYMDLPNSMLYKRQGLLEHCVRQYDFRPVKSFIVKENVGAIIINGYALNAECTKGVETTKVLSLDDTIYQKHFHDIGILKKTFEKNRNSLIDEVDKNLIPFTKMHYVDFKNNDYIFL